MRGAPDFGMYEARENVVTISDMGEVAARLGSIVIYDRRGLVVDFDSFEESIIRWNVSPQPEVHSYARLDDASVKSGSQAVRLHTHDVAGAYIYLQRGILVPFSKRLGIELSFSNLSSDCMLYLGLHYYGAEGTPRALIKVVPPVGLTPGELSVYDNTPGWQKVADIAGMATGAFLFHTVKLIADFTALTENGDAVFRYARLLYDIDEYDISNYKMAFVAAGLTPYVKREIQLWTREATGGDCWIDDMIFTQVEP